MTTATNLTPSKTALVGASSANAPGWKWYFFSEESEGVFNGFVKSPFCPEGEYGLILSSDLIDIPWVWIEMDPNNVIKFGTEEAMSSMDLMRKIGRSITKK